MPKEFFGANVKCFGDIVLGDLLKMAMSNPAGGSSEQINPQVLLDSYKEMLAGYAKDVEKAIVSLMLGGGAEVASGTADLSLALTFDSAKKFTGVKFNAELKADYTKDYYPDAELSMENKIDFTAEFVDTVTLTDLSGMKADGGPGPVKAGTYDFDENEPISVQGSNGEEYDLEYTCSLVISEDLSKATFTVSFADSDDTIVIEETLASNDAGKEAYENRYGEPIPQTAPPSQMKRPSKRRRSRSTWTEMKCR